MTTTMEQVVAQLQQELFSLRAQVASQVHMAEAVRAINWQGRGFPTVVEEDGGILRWSDQGIRDDVGVGS